MSLAALDWLPDSVCRWLPLPADGELPALPDAEAALVAGWAERRRSHFIAGRACARAALAALGHPGAAIGRSADGAPIWPTAVVGSIGHCAAGAVAITASTAHWSALGVDIEIDRVLPDDAAGYVLGAAERDRLAALPGGLAHWGLAAFCAKECVHKCLYPLAGLFLEFGEVEILFDPASECFTVLPLSARAVEGMAGRQWQGAWRRIDGLLMSLLAARPAEGG